MDNIDIRYYNDTLKKVVIKYCDGSYEKAEFTIKTDFECIPSWFRVDCKDDGNNLLVDDLNCEDKCPDNGNCWCDFIGNMIENRSADAKFRMDGGIDDYYIIINSIMINQTQFEMRITFEKAEDQIPRITSIDHFPARIILKWYQNMPDGTQKRYCLATSKYLTQAELKTEIPLDYLPNDIICYDSGDIYDINDLRCPDSGCIRETDNLCWCQLLESINDQDPYKFKITIPKKKNEAQTILCLTVSKKEDDSDTGIFVFSFEYQGYNSYNNYNYNSYNHDSPSALEFEETNHGQTRCVKLESKKYLDKTAFYFDCLQLPDQIKFKQYSITYTTNEGLNCPDGKICPLDRPCWCRLIDQFKTDQRAQLRFPLKSYTNNANYWLIVLASRDNDNRYHLIVKCRYKGYSGYKYYNTREQNEDEVWIPEGQEDNPYKQFLYFDPE